MNMFAKVSLIIAAGMLAAIPATVAAQPDYSPGAIASMRTFAAADRAAATAFTDTISGKGTTVPFGFVYGENSADMLDGSWKERHSTSTDSLGRRKTVRTFVHRPSGLEARCEITAYADYPAAEWVVYLRNTGRDTTALIKDIRVLDRAFATASTSPAIHYNIGGKSGIEEFQPAVRRLAVADTLRMGSYWGGFPTADFLPFFNAEWGGADSPRGLITAIGWPTRWEIGYTRPDESTLTVAVGQLRTSLRLAPGEEIRTPLVVTMFWQGDCDDAQNMWRAWMWDYNVPRPGGRLPDTMLEAASSPFFAEMFHAHDTDQMQFIDGYADHGIGLDYWWMDAGWYPNKGGTWQDLLGSWWPDPARYPDGLKAISRHAARRGHRTMLWFEPERVTPDSWLWNNHPEWLLKVPHEGWPGFFNYGNPEARQWMLNRVDSILTTEEISLYRQDFAVMSGDYWDEQDRLRPDRTGMAENAHATGYLLYVDSLLARHPGMMMDICAAGGKRLELENLRRAVPMWRSDYAFEPTGVQGQTMGISPWIPYSGAGVNRISAYDIRSNMSPSIVLNLDARRDDADWATLRRHVDQWRAIGPDYRGDYYPLTPYSIAPDAWAGWMFFRPETGTGFIQMFRRAGSRFESGRWPLRGLNPDAVYTITDMDSGHASTATGSSLLSEGLLISLPASRSDVLLRIAPAR